MPIITQIIIQITPNFVLNFINLLNFILRMRCTSCGKEVTKYVEFKCPKCEESEGAYKIVRCDACRVLGRKYVCPKCGFTGP
ncbi:conserved hypothetical protein [groundwater metagenome]|uniref:Small zinc finger protein HVO-2753-like zinc-binding pocket domain-containing protein n=1 Tax=groundwater metagenome TaxID=717931 RepID=A0A098E999_9ZZZZ